MSENITKSTTELDRRLRNLRINETEQMLKLLDSASVQYSFPILQEQDARHLLLESLERFRVLYGAKVMSSVTNNDSSHKVKIEFSFMPDRPEDLIRLLNYMKKSISPIYHIVGMAFEKVKDERKVVFKVEMIQPYMGGKYVF
ncbi:MAG: hypothetical protein C0603_13000 [Denitrovibrio sp.]|nr:MAG: hypothetical protein C0603_13000 [Denitrovibrio sp.]